MTTSASVSNGFIRSAWMTPLTLVNYGEQDMVVEVLADSREVHNCSDVDAREKG